MCERAAQGAFTVKSALLKNLSVRRTGRPNIKRNLVQYLQSVMTSCGRAAFCACHDHCVRVRVKPESPNAARLGLRQGPYLHICTKISSGYMTRIKIAWQSWHVRP